MTRAAIVTGAGTGIGRHVSLALLADGFSVALKPDRNQFNRDVADHLKTASSITGKIDSDHVYALL